MHVLSNPNSVSVQHPGKEPKQFIFLQLFPTPGSQRSTFLCNTILWQEVPMNMALLLGLVKYLGPWCVVSQPAIACIHRPAVSLPVFTAELCASSSVPVGGCAM